MSNQKSSEREKRNERIKQSIPDTGQGPAGDLGSDADLGANGDSDNKRKKGKQKSPIPIKRKEKPDVSS